MSYDSIASLYDSAFSWESNPEEILPLWERMGRPDRVIETACGPARMLATLVARGVHGVGVDISEPMLELARQRLEAIDFGSYELRLARLEAFELQTPAGGAFCAVGSFGHLDTLRAAEEHMHCMRAALRPGASYCVHLRLRELGELRGSGEAGPQPGNSWKVRVDGETLSYTWYRTGIVVSQQQEVQRSRFEWHSGRRLGEVIETDHLMRVWDWQTWQALLSRTGFEQVAALDAASDFSELPLGEALHGGPGAWHVLRRG